MTPQEIFGYFLVCVQKYARFDGRARRREFWSFKLVYLLISFVIAAFDSALGLMAELTLVNGQVLAIGYISAALAVLMLLPDLAVTVRRFHDSGRSGWWVLTMFIPFVGLFISLFFWLLDSDQDNQYGPNPKGNTGFTA